ncbi:MAG: nucleoside triphosphate pyrophosphatase [Rubrobacteraceae bacterium]|nr:nucleoside triphosphate pyrophosphatase [Rubrobacteraceae bacterium]
MQFVLASESPRRVALLRGVGYDFSARKSGFPEVVLDDPKETVQANARGKALTVASELPGEIILAADTIVYLPELPTDEATLGQAKDREDARRMLGLLEGQVHEVYSGVAVARDGDISVRGEVTRVRLRRLSEQEISAYVKLGEGVGKAGGYAIQGRAALFVERIEGDYTNVVGLPLALTSRMLENYGVRWY